MLGVRVIPCLLLRDKGLVKGIKFSDHRYIGDPMNAVRIFNDKDADEIVFLDITATKEGRKPSLELIQKVADESFMPFTVGGGINSIEDIRKVINGGAEKVAINTAAIDNPNLIKEASKIFGNQSIVVSIDVKKSLTGKYKVYRNSGTKATKLDPIEFAKKMESFGAGEILLNSIDKEGTMEGYDLNIVKKISDAVNIPIIVCGGAGKVEHFVNVVKKGASAVAAGSMFVFHGPRRAVLISYPFKEELEGVLDR